LEVKVQHGEVQGTAVWAETESSVQEWKQGQILFERPKDFKVCTWI
jgi:hypothetical protein